VPQTIDTGLKLAKTLLKDLKDGPDSRKHKHSKQTQESVEKTEEQPVSKRSEPAKNNAPEGEDASLDRETVKDSEPTMEEIGKIVVMALLKDLKDRPDSREHKQSTPTQESVEKTKEKPASKRSEPANNNAPEGEDAFLDNLAFTDSEPTKGEIEEIIFNSATPDRAAKIHELEQGASSNKHLSDRIMKIVKEHGGKVKIGKRNAGKNGKTDLLGELFALVEKHAAAEGLDLTKEEIFELLGQKLDEGLAALDTVVHKEQ
jgi:hypothetical protein